MQSLISKVYQALQKQGEDFTITSESQEILQATRDQSLENFVFKMSPAKSNFSFLAEYDNGRVMPLIPYSSHNIHKIPHNMLEDTPLTDKSDTITAVETKMTGLQGSHPHDAGLSSQNPHEDSEDSDESSDSDDSLNNRQENLDGELVRKVLQAIAQQGMHVTISSSARQQLNQMEQDKSRFTCIVTLQGSAVVMDKIAEYRDGVLYIIQG